MPADTVDRKERVRAHWEAETCGIRYGTADDARTYFREIRETRYHLEPYILPFQNAESFRGQRVLEIGVGAGSDFLQWIRAGVNATGIDLTEAAITRTRDHLLAEGFDIEDAQLRIADAEALPFDDASFDAVYSYGVLHHSPDPPSTLREARRVLRPGGALRIMLYHVPSWTSWMLWAVHGVMCGKPFVRPRRVVYEHLESPGTSSYTVREAITLLEGSGFAEIRAELHLGPGDLLLIRPSSRYRSFAARLAWKVYPRPLVRLLGNRFGLVMLLSARAI